MNPKAKSSNSTVLAMISAGLLAAALSGPTQAANPCAARNPCAAKAANPCAAKNPCAANPCAAGPKINRKDVVRPAGYKPLKGDHATLARQGEALFKDTKLSTNGMSCNTCHQGNNAFQASFSQPYPHRVQMAKDDLGLKTIHLDEMVQLCMVKPMAAKPLPWKSEELAALVAYVGDVQK